MHKHLKTLIIGITSLMAICVGWYLFLYQPKASKIDTLKKDTEELLLKLRSLRVTDEQIEALESRIGQLRSEIDEMEAKLMSKSDLPRVVQLIRREGRAHGLRFVSVIPDYKNLTTLPGEVDGTRQVLKLTVHLKMRGYYKNFGNFVHSLPELPFYISIGEVTLLYNEVIHPEIEILLDTVLYLRETKSASARASLRIRDQNQRERA